MAVRYKSFRDRGVYVGFHGRNVEMLRCRAPKDPRLHDFEAIVPNFGGTDLARTASDLVMPFKDVPNWSELVGRDELLHDRVSQSYRNREGYLDPITVRDMRMETDLEAGDEKDRQIAENEIKISKADVQNAFLEILAMFGRKYAEIRGEADLRGVSRQVLVSLSENSPDDMVRLVRVIVGAVVSGASIGRDELQGRLDTLSDYASPICSMVTDDKSRSVGYLSRQMALLEELRDGVAAYCVENRTHEVVEAGHVIDANLNTFIDYALERAHMIKNAVLDESYYLNNKKYESLLAMIREERIRISFALDGWAGHATRWLSVDEEDTAARNAVLTFILRQMPAPPTELDDFTERRYGGDNPMQMRRRAVKEMHSWLDDKLDAEMHRRVLDTRAVTEAKSGDAAKTPSKKIMRRALSAGG